MATEFYLLSIQGSVNGQYNEVVQCFQGVGVASADTLAAGSDLLAAWDASVRAKWLAALPASYNLDRIAARRAFPKPSATAHAQYLYGTQIGSGTGAGASYNLCPCIIMIPPLGVKSAGKTFMPAVPDGAIINNVIQTAYNTTLNTLFNQLITGFTGSLATWTLAVYSRKNNSGSLVQAITKSLKLGFQGRRRKPVGSA